VACRTVRQKRDLVRVVRTPDGRVEIDETGRLAGRGAYLCADGSCWRQAVERGTLQRALEAKLPEKLRERLLIGAGVAAAATTIQPGTHEAPANISAEPQHPSSPSARITE
jgi:predicted RNA-binding protein YlxR (DUF448 family)